MPVPAGGDLLADPDLLATTADLAALLQIPEADLDTAAALVALEGATAAVQAAAGGQRILEVVDDEETIYGTTGYVMLLPQRPVTAITSVTYAGSLLTNGTASGCWQAIPNGLWRDVGWAATTDCHAPSPITVVYTHGYPAGHQALQLARSATLSLARSLYANPAGVAREQIDDYAVAYDKATAALDGSPTLRAALRRQYGRRGAFARPG